MDGFLTIEEHVTTEVVEKKSRFIANLFPCESIEEAERLIKETKKKYYDARHNCVAYRILKDGINVERSNDDGEPSGTAGEPMLTILQKNNLSNILIIVTRYFGGTLLGTGGLVRAYSESLKKAIELGKKVEKCGGIEFFVTMKYEEFDNFKYYCKKNNILIINVEYSENISCNIDLLEEKKEEFINDFETKKVNLNNIKELNKKYITINI